MRSTMHTVLYVAAYTGNQITSSPLKASILSKPWSIMPKFLPIVLLSSAQKCCLLCSIYVLKYCNYATVYTQFYYFSNQISIVRLQTCGLLRYAAAGTFIFDLLCSKLCQHNRPGPNLETVIIYIYIGNESIYVCVHSHTSLSCYQQLWDMYHSDSDVQPVAKEKVKIIGYYQQIYCQSCSVCHAAAGVEECFNVVSQHLLIICIANNHDSTSIFRMYDVMLHNIIQQNFVYSGTQLYNFDLFTVCMHISVR